MTEAPIDLSRPSPPPLIPIRRFKGGLQTKRQIHKDVQNCEDDDKQFESNSDNFPGRPTWSHDVQARLGVPTVAATQVNRKALRVCVNNNSIPSSNTPPLTGSQGADVLSEDQIPVFGESTCKWSWLASLSRSHSVPNVAHSAAELCPRRKAMSEERVTEGNDDSDDRPRKRRRLYDESLECERDMDTTEPAWRNQVCRKSLTGRHVRSGTGAAPATLKGLRDKILSRRLSAAADVR